MSALSLRPRTAAELLDQALRLYRRHFFKFIGLVALTVLPFTVLQALAAGLNALPFASTLNPNSAFEALVPISVMGAVTLQLAGSVLHFILVQGVATACITQALKDDVLNQSVSLFSTLKRLKDRWVELLLAVILTYALALFGGLFMLIPCLGWFFGIGLVMFFTGVVMPILIPVIIYEKKHAITVALRRAWELTRPRFWSIIRYLFVLGMFQQVVAAGPIVLLVAAFFWFLTNFISSPEAFGILAGGQVIFQAVLVAFSNVLLVPLQVSAINALYLDLRVRADGLDLAWQAAQVSQLPAAGVLQETAVTASPWLRQEDRRNLILLSLLFFVLIFALIALYFLFLFTALSLRGL